MYLRLPRMSCSLNRSTCEICCLNSRQLAIEAIGTIDQGVVRAVLDDAALVDRNDAITEAQGRQTMCDDDDRSSLDNLSHVGLYDLLAFIIQGTCSFVKYQDARLWRQCPGNGDTLPLASRKVGPALLDWRVVTEGKLGNKFICSCKARYPNHLRATHSRNRERDIFV